MLQEFYKDTLQSNYIKYILSQEYIPTVPFTSNILHVTKGNTYIHNGYFVRAKISDAIQAINEDVKKYPNKYDDYFAKYEPYVFGKWYPGLTTNYKSNTKGYDSTTHYYLGEYLRAYKAYYGIDLMPFYNCYSNEYIDYLYLNYNVENHHIEIKNSQNKKYKLVSVPIKFCTKYTIAIQCNTEVAIAPMFIGKKGLLKDKTDQLYMINSWGKKYPRINFNNPIVYESPHINSVNDLTQSYLQTYDKYLKLIIQVPENNNSSIVVLEGEYSNTKPFQTRYINTSAQDIKETYSIFYDTKLPSYGNVINIPNNSYLYCENINSQRYCYTFDNNNIITFYNEQHSKENISELKTIRYQGNDDAIEELITNGVIEPPNKEIKIGITDVTSKNTIEDNEEEAPFLNSIDIEEEVVKETTESLEEVILENVPEVVEETPPLVEKKTYKYELPLALFCTDLNITDKKLKDENGKDKNIQLYSIKINSLEGFNFSQEDLILKNEQNSSIYYIASTVSLWFEQESENNSPLSLSEIINKFKNVEGVNILNGESRVVATLEEGENNIACVEYKYFYITPSMLSEFKYSYKDDNDNSIEKKIKLINIVGNNGISINYEILQNNLRININKYNYNDAKFISLSNPIYIQGKDNWELVSQVDDVLFNLNDYLNKYLVSNLTLLKFNNHISYAFSSRLIEYLVNSVITRNEMVSKNIQRVQQAVNIHNERPIYKITLKDDNDNDIEVFTNKRKSNEIIVNDLWSDQLRIEAFKDTLDLNNYYDYFPLYDINGFIDKDSEKLLSIKNEV